MRLRTFKSGVLGVALIALGAFVDPASAAPIVKLPLQAYALDDAQLQERTVGQDEPFALQRLSALKSVTLKGDVTVAAAFGTAVFVSGGQLLWAQGADRRDFFCGDYQTDGIGMVGLAKAARTQWVCFVDAERDGVFDVAYSAQNNAGAMLPSFSGLADVPISVKVEYTEDAEANLDYYETAIVFQKTFNIYGLTGFRAQGRRKSETKWNDLTSTGMNVMGSSTMIKPNNLPKTFELNGVKIEFVAKSKDSVTVRPISAPVGALVFGVRQVIPR